MASFAVSNKFTAKDGVTKTFGNMGKGADRFGKRSSRAFRDASRSASRFQDITKGILTANIIQKGFGRISEGISTVTGEFLDFDQAVISASAKFKGLNLATQEGQKVLLDLKKTARGVGAATQFSAGQAAQGLDFLAMAGFNAQQAMAALPGVVDLATVANVDLGRATDIASDSLGAFGLMTKDATQLQKNFTRINDVMALTMSRTNTNMEDMFEAVKKGAPDFTKAGQSLESFSALLGVMANAGKKGSEAGTTLRNIMLRLADPTKEARKAIKTIGIETADASGNFRDIVDILADIEKGTKGMGEVQKTAALSTIFGARAVGGINILLTEGSKKIRDFRSELEGSAGASKKMADIMRTSLTNRLKSLSSAAIEFGFKFFTAFEKQAGGAIDKLTEAIRTFDPTPIINGLKTAMEFAKGLFNAVQPFIPALPVIIGGFLAYGAALKGLAIGQAVIGFITFLTTLKSMTAVWGILNAVMAANPLGAIITGITAVVALMVVLEKKFGALTKLWEGIKGAGRAIGGFFNPRQNRQFQERVEKFKASKIGMDGGAGGKLALPEIGMDGGARGKLALPKIGMGEGIREIREERRAPNKEEVEAKQKIAFNGRLDIAGAPEGSTVSSDGAGAPPLDLNLMGLN